MPQMTLKDYSLRTHLMAFAGMILAPVVLLVGLLLANSVSLERRQLEARLIQVADALADDVDRDIVRDFTLLNTLATMPSLASEDWATFYANANAALQGKAYVIVIDTSLRQLVNTYVPFGSQPVLTGDPETARQMLASKQPLVSDLFISKVTRRPVFNVNIPVMRNGEVKFLLLLGQLTDDILQIAKEQALGPEWTTSVIDRKGVILARSRDNDRYVGTMHPDFARLARVTSGGVIDGRSLDGQPILRAVVRSKQTGWLVTASVAATLATAPVYATLWQWLGVAGLIFAVAIGLAWLYARVMEAPLRSASEAAAALGREEEITAPRSRVAEANTIHLALERASAELRARAAHKSVLLHELSHRVKNVLAVVQAIAMRTFPKDGAARGARDTFLERLQALGRAHEVLMRTDWSGAPLRAILTAELEPFAERTQISGPDLVLDGAIVQTLTLLVHELATNAVKYGALSNDIGRVHVRWAIDGGNARFKFRWEEQGGPPVEQPARRGFGSALLESGISADADVTAKLSYEPDGFVYELDAPLAAVQQRRPAHEV